MVRKLKTVFRYIFFFLKKLSVLFVGPLISLFWTSGDICGGFQSQGGSSHFHALSPWCNRFTSGLTPLVGQTILIHTLVYYKHWCSSSPGSRVPLPYSVWQDRRSVVQTELCRFCLLIYSYFCIIHCIPLYIVKGLDLGSVQIHFMKIRNSW